MENLIAILLAGGAGAVETEFNSGLTELARRLHAEAEPALTITGERQ